MPYGHTDLDWPWPPNDPDAEPPAAPTEETRPLYLGPIDTGRHHLDNKMGGVSANRILNSLNRITGGEHVRYRNCHP